MAYYKKKISLSIKKTIPEYTVRIGLLVGPNLKHYSNTFYDRHITNWLDYDNKVFEIKCEYIYERDYKS